MTGVHDTDAAFITGGTRGIGKAIALKAARTARTVILNYLQNDAEAEKTKAEVERLGAACILIRANLLFPDDIDRMFETVNRATTSIDWFAHCAALNTFKPLLDIKPNQFDLTMNVNARSFLLCIQRIVPLMEGGSIVAVSSLGSQRAVPAYGALGPTKAALEAIVRQCAFELAPRGIRVNAVNGGLIETSSIEKFPEAEIMKAKAVQRTPAGRLGTAEEIAEIVLFLAGSSSRWINGQTIVADGGFSIV